ncbi:MAG: hypothetical protein ABL956_03090 [Hyphomonadaceae bacterium]
MNAPPIACMLSGTDFKQRLEEIADLNRKSLRHARRDDLRLTLSYKPGALGQVQLMVEQELACCPFLSFDVTAHETGVTLTITAPEEARGTVDSLFEPFQQANVAKGGCSCPGSAA